MKLFWLPVLLLSAATLWAAEPRPVYKLSAAELEARLRNDAQAVEVERHGLREVISYVEAHPDLFPAQPPPGLRLLRREQKEAVWSTWQRLLDYVVALDGIEDYHRPFMRLKDEDAREDSFLIGRAAMLAKYRAVLEFTDRTENDSELHKVLNEPVPELGLPGGTYAKLKFKYLNGGMGTRFAARELVAKTFSGERQAELSRGIVEDADAIWKAGEGRGELLTLKNALKIVQNGAESAWLPIQTGVSEWMGHTKVYRNGESLISLKQIRELPTRLQPGDILLERREWYVSNIGLPGFWSHAALYIGTAEERRAFFADTNVQAWVREQGEPSGDFEALLQARSPTAYQQSRTQREAEHDVRIMEAIGEGVSLTSLEHSASCDSLAALRPRRGKIEKAAAILRAFHYFGRPYDFNFDFATDSELVCTELVYKCYEHAADRIGLTFPLVEMLGRQVTPANEIARQFALQCKSPEQQTDLVLFLDGHEQGRKVIEASIEEFCQSWRRPKWHVLIQE